VTSGAAWQAVRLPLYAVAAAASVLLVVTVFRQRLVAFESATAMLGFGLLLGVLLGAIAPALHRLSVQAGCGMFAVASLALAVVVYALLGSVLPGMAVTFAGSLLGGAVATCACGVVFSLLDERPVVADGGIADG
jgi:hypothetical protein